MTFNRAIQFVLSVSVVLGTMGAAAQEPEPVTYAIRGARIVTVSGAPIENGLVVMRDGILQTVGPDAAPPAGAVVIDGEGLTVYPGLIDMGRAVGMKLPEAPRAENPETTEDVERAKRARLLRAAVRAADHLDPDAAGLARLAENGVTAVLATPDGDVFRGQSALIATALRRDAPQIGALADPRQGLGVIRTPVAQHVSFPGRPGGGNAYPNSLMGVIAFARQTFIDAQYYQAAQAFAAQHPSGELPPPHDAALAALAPVLDGSEPVAFEAETAREIRRALEMAKEFSLGSPIITNGREAGEVTADLKAADARVLVSLDYPERPVSLGPDADEPLADLRDRADAPKTAGLLEKAGVPFAFMSGSLEKPQDFLAHVRKAVAAGLSKDRALRAITLDAATIAGAADRIGSLQPGKIASLIVVDGDLFDDNASIKYVFVEGNRVDLNLRSSDLR